jgi:4a-hydroxytetrahydrobiopterin dehydratase
MRPKKLSDERIHELLSRLNGWELTNDSISKTFILDNFSQSMEFVNQLAEIAEEVQHHPDIDIRFNKVILTLSTHDVGGLTDNDFYIANVAEQLDKSPRVKVPA